MYYKTYSIYYITVYSMCIYIYTSTYRYIHTLPILTSRLGFGVPRQKLETVQVAFRMQLVLRRVPWFRS